jgi:hypothetical protein
VYLVPQTWSSMNGVQRQGAPMADLQFAPDQDLQYR